MATRTSREFTGPIPGIIFVVLLILVASFAYHWMLAPGPTTVQQAANDVAAGATNVWHDKAHGNTRERFHSWLQRHSSDYRDRTR